MKYIIFVFYLMFSLKGMFAMEYEKASIALVTNFLALQRILWKEF